MSNSFTVEMPLADVPSPNLNQMKTRSKIILFFTCSLGLAVAAHGSDRWETLEAIHWVENPHNSTRLGPHGELGPYQFRQSTWRMYSRRPFYEAINREYSDEVAVKHYEWLKQGLENAGIEITPYNIAMAWNAGLDAVIGKHVPMTSHAYAEQVTNLVEQVKRNELAAVGQ
ncbi:MAG: hypothetical protein ABSE59_01390 [Opitutaceae bacterium]